MWSFGATAVLMQPTNKNFDYSDQLVGNFAASNDTSNAVSVQHNTVDEGYDWWFGADITYAFPGNGRDITLAYEGLHGTDTDSATTDTFGALASSFSGQNYLTSEGETDTRYDAGDLVFGQKLDVGSRIRLHPFAGVRYAHINTEDTAVQSGGQENNGNGGVLASSENDELNNTFNGIGPRFGTDAQVNLGQGFSIRGRLGLSALIGSHSIKAKASLTNYNPDGTVLAVGAPAVTVADDSETRVIPEIDGRLGLNYTVDFNSNMALGFELGWQATNYFNVISDQPSTTDIFSNGNGSGGLPSTHYDKTSNFGLQGPYARVQLDVA
jgi:hypothetical protein